MIKINENYEKLNSSYLFADIANRIAEFQKRNKDLKIIRMGIGDVIKPLPKVCIDALHNAIDEMALEESFKGYGPEAGYSFLREAVAKNDFIDKGCPISADEIFISDGSKCDTANIQEIFSNDITIAVPDPVYPVYVDSNVMAGRTGDYTNEIYKGIVYLESTPANNFVPELPDQKVDLIYLCFPNNPTGATVSKKELQTWVEYAKKNKSIILFDAAYTAFIKDKNLPHSIYEIDGANEVAIEFRSYSKTAGFTGLRCAYTVVPKKCCAYKKDGSKIELNSIWNRRQSTKFNGVSYPVQKAAEAIYSLEGKKEIQETIDYYLNNAKIIRKHMDNLGYNSTGGENSPYIWVHTGGNSWDFFDKLLQKAGVVITPGAGFGKCGKEFIRISAFNSLENVEEAMERLKKVL